MGVLNLFTFNSRSRLLRCFALLLAMGIPLFVCNAIIGIKPIGNRYPSATIYFHPGVSVRAQLLSEMLDKQKTIDSIFIGSSIVRTNVSPLLFDEIVNQQCKSNHRSFNLGMSGLFPREVLFYLERKWLKTTKPKTVIQGIRLAELQWRERKFGEETLERGIIEKLWQGTLIDRTRAAISDKFELLQYPGVISKTLLKFSRGGISWPVFDYGFNVDSRGYNSRKGSLKENKLKKHFKKELPYNDLAHEESINLALETLSKTIALTHKHGKKYILVNLPEHSFKYSGAKGGEIYNRYLSILRDFSEREHIAFVDLTDGDHMAFSDESLYIDYHHLNEAGSSKVTTILANKISKTLCR